VPPVYPVTGHVQHRTEVPTTATGAPRDTRARPPYGAARTAGARGPSLTLDAHRRRRTGPATGLVLLLAAVFLPVGWPLGPGTAAAAGNCKLTLAGGQAAPGSGTPQTAIDFALEVSHKAACSPPATVRVTIAGLASPTLALTPGQPSTAAGTTSVTYTGQRTIGAAGTWTYEFAARLTAADPWVILAGTAPAALTINVPATPKPTAKPTPKPTPTPKPAPKPTVKPTKAPPKSTPKPRQTRAPETTSDPKETPVATTPPATVEPSAPPASDPPPSGPDATRRPLTAAVMPPPGGPLPPRGPRLTPPTSPLPTGTSPFDIALVLVAWIAFATAGSLLFAFALARRTGEDEDLPPFAFAMATAGAAASVAEGAAPPAGTPDAVEDVPDPEALIPRWRRPSLQAARQSHWAEEAGARVAQRFPAGATRGERRIVAYRLVFVADRPEDRDAVELGRLDRGDEVELLALDNGFALVRAPDGLEGWVDASTLDEPPV
jgi:hypothetical protein